MVRALSTTTLLTALLGFALGCGIVSAKRGADGSGSKPAPRLEVPDLFFLPGEVFQWEVSFRGVTAGRAVMAVGEPGREGERDVLILRSRVESAGVAAALSHVRDEITTWIGLDAGAPVLHHADIRSADPEAMVQTEFGEGPFEIDVSRVGRSPRTYRQELPENYYAHDIHSLLGALRAWQADPGDEGFAYLLSGRRIYHFTATYGEVESLSTKFGPVEAVRIDAIAWRLQSDLEVDPDRSPRELRLWLARDGTRAPVRIEADTEHGTVNIELVGHDRPDARITAAP